MRRIFIAAGIVALSQCIVTFGAKAQSPPVAWSALTKTTNGTCVDGMVLDIVERPGILKWTSKTAVREVPLAKDGTSPRSSPR
jgi:hypothetical protein